MAGEVLHRPSFLQFCKTTQFKCNIVIYLRISCLQGKTFFPDANTSSSRRDESKCKNWVVELMRLHENINFMQTCCSWISRVMTEEWELAINLRDKAMISMFEKLWSGDGEKRWRWQWCYVTIMHWFDWIDSEIKMFWHWTATTLSTQRKFPFPQSEISLRSRAKQRNFVLSANRLSWWNLQFNGFRTWTASQPIYFYTNFHPKAIKIFDQLHCEHSAFPFPVMLYVRSTGFYNPFMLSFNVAFM